MLAVWYEKNTVCGMVRWRYGTMVRCRGHIIWLNTVCMYVVWYCWRYGKGKNTVCGVVRWRYGTMVWCRGYIKWLVLHGGMVCFSV